MSGKKITNMKNGIVWSSRAVNNSVMHTLTVTYLSFYATDVLGMSVTLIATLLLITKLFDGVTDLIAGYIIDNTHTRWGKGRPYEWCIPFVGLFTILLFSAPMASEMVQAVFLGTMYVLATAVFGTLIGASENVYFLRAFPEEKERNSIYGISTVFGQIVNVIAMTVVPILVAQAGTSHSA